MLGHRALNVGDYLLILKRRWWIIAIPAVIFPILAIGATYLVTPQYMSTTLVLIDDPKVPGDIAKPVQTEALDSRLAYMQEQILSRTSIEPIITRYNLFGTKGLSMDQRVEIMRNPSTLKIEPVQSEIARSNGLPGFTIAFTASDPHTAQQVCADITSLFTKANLTSRHETAEDTTGFLQEQLDSAQRSLNDMDAKLAKFQSEHFGSLPGDQGNDMSMITSTQSQLDAATGAINSLEQDQSVTQTLLTQEQQQVAQMAAAPAAVPVQSPQTEEKELEQMETDLANLTLNHTDDYPDVKTKRRQIADLQAQMAREAAAPTPVISAAPVTNRPDTPRVVALKAHLNADALAIQSKRKLQDQLQAQMRSFEGKLQASPEVAAQYKELTRDYDEASAFYNDLQKKKNQSQMTTDLENRQEGGTFTVLDAANLPTEPTFPKQGVFAGGGLGAGLALGVLIVVLLEYKDTALRNERDVWEFTQLPTLAVIAWSGGLAHAETEKHGRLKRLFGRKSTKDQLAGTAG